MDLQVVFGFYQSNTKLNAYELEMRCHHHAQQVYYCYYDRRSVKVSGSTSHPHTPAG